MRGRPRPTRGLSRQEKKRPSTFKFYYLSPIVVSLHTSHLSSDSGAEGNRKNKLTNVDNCHPFVLLLPFDANIGLDKNNCYVRLTARLQVSILYEDHYQVPYEKFT
jgi:hypothetical protein